MVSIMRRTVLLMGPIAAGLLGAGCASTSAPRSRLGSPAQAERFVVSVASGADAGAWAVPAGAAGPAARAWQERRAIADLGSMLRHEGGAWVCELARSSYQVTAVGIFTSGDRRPIASAARSSGASEAQIQTAFADVERISRANLRAAINAICPYSYLE